MPRFPPPDSQLAGLVSEGHYHYPGIMLTVDAKAGRSRDAGGDGRGRGLAEGGSGADLRPNTRISIAAGRGCAVDC